MFNITLLSFFAKYGPNSVFHKIGLKNQKTNIVRRRHRRNLKCRATPPSGQQEQQCVFFSFFFEGTKSLSAILNLQPGIEIYMKLFRRIKLRPFSTLIIFFALTLGSVHKLLTFTRFWLFWPPTYSPVFTFAMVWTFIKSGQCLTTYY